MSEGATTRSLYHRVEDDLHASVDVLTALGMFIGDKDDAESVGTARIILDQVDRLKRIQSVLSDGDAA